MAVLTQTKTKYLKSYIWYDMPSTCCTSAQVKSLRKRPQIRNIWWQYLQPDVQLVLYVKFLTHFQQVPDDGLQISRNLLNTWHYCSNMAVIDSGFVHLFIHVTAGSLAHKINSREMRYGRQHQVTRAHER